MKYAVLRKAYTFDIIYGTLFDLLDQSKRVALTLRAIRKRKASHPLVIFCYSKKSVLNVKAACNPMIHLCLLSEQSECMAKEDKSED